jgi:hypothetical protein
MHMHVKRHTSRTLIVVVASLIAALAFSVMANADSHSTRSGIAYSGTGTMLLPPLRLAHWSVVHWSTNGDLFMLIALSHPAATGPNPQLIVSQAHSGVGYLPPGTYRFKVGAWPGEHWRFTITRSASSA